ncbi:unnamed protein product [Acanthoscelides obtectus]|uniref:Uncharacterized protein n=1 Tax=Acanthoscelides obtectus TaxID=200917 RepID=A0A9P0L3E8_ACAOB|nr:unnamed protein product [Acanthoscelides obtectus]CAK1653832.1 hypothetical protein AOBTE_LOCUS18378 [Acanthoscelides obtectus]
MIRPKSMVSLVMNNEGARVTKAIQDKTVRLNTYPVILVHV